MKDNKQSSQIIEQLFKKTDPLSLNGKSIYKNDYLSLLSNNWLRTGAIDSVLNILHSNFLQQINGIIFNSIKHKKQGEELSLKYKKYVNIIDPFIVTMIQFIRDKQTLMTLKQLQIFHHSTKYIMFPLNTELTKGNHWFLILLRNPFYNQNINQNQQPFQYNGNIFILNSTSTMQSFKQLVNSFKDNLINLINIYNQDKLNKLQVKIKIIELNKNSIQSNSYDCGIFTIGYVQKVLNIFKIQIQRQIKLKIINNKEEVQQNIQIYLQNSKNLRKKYQQLLQEALIKQNFIQIQS